MKKNVKINTNLRSRHFHQHVLHVQVTILSRELLPPDDGPCRATIDVLLGAGIPPRLVVTGGIVFCKLKTIVRDQHTFFGALPYET